MQCAVLARSKSVPEEIQTGVDAHLPSLHKKETLYLWHSIKEEEEDRR